MSDDFGTVNMNRRERARELEVLRQHYRRHREALQSLIGDAPTETLAAEYQRLIRDIDGSLTKLDELEGRAPAGAAAAAASTAATQFQRGAEFEQPHGDPLRAKTQPGTRPLVPQPAYEEVNYDNVPPPETTGSRVPMMIAAAVLVLALIGGLLWWASGKKRTDAPVVEETAGTGTTMTAPVSNTAPVTAAVPDTIAPAAGSLKVTPASTDYGTVRKGTRAVRQYSIQNTGTEPVTVQVARSGCRCLYYEYHADVKGKGKEALTVTIDGARAKAGTLHETIQVSSKKNPSETASFEVIANIQ